MITLTLALAAIGLPPQAATSDAIEQRVKECLAKMSTEEKIDLIGGVKGFYIRELPQFGLPELKMSDGPLGVRNYGPTTAYPAGTTLASTWDPELAKQFGAAMGRDARARGVHILLGPGVNLSRVPQCGRNFEYFGEDPLLAGQLGAKVIQGIQSKGVVATIKHYAANEHESDRNLDSSEVDERTLRELYLKPFEIGVKEGGVWAVMCSYNLLNGTYASENDWLLNQVLRKDWDFPGIVMSDWGAVHSALGPAKYGLDLEMPGPDYMNRKNLLPALKDGTLTIDKIDEKVTRILRMAFAMEFDKRAQEDKSIAKDDPANAAVAEKIAREGTVLLKNSRNLLPLDPNKKQTIVVVGPNAVATPSGGGGSSWTTPTKMLNFLDALRKEVGPKTKIVYSPIQEAVASKVFKYAGYFQADGTPGLKAEYFKGTELEGQPVETKTETSIDLRWENKTQFSVRWTGNLKVPKTGDYIIVSRVDDGVRVWLGRRRVINEWHDQAVDTRMVQVRLKKDEVVPVKVEYYQRDGEAEARFGIISVDEVATAGIAEPVLKSADAVIACVGFTGNTEAEGFDRPFQIPFFEESMLKHLVAINPNVIVINNSGAGVDMSTWVDRASAVIQAWYPGQNGSRAIAQIVTGKVNPSGKLPTTFPRKLADTYYADAYPPVNHKIVYKEGLLIGYRWFDTKNVEPLFPFGHGLSYTTFKISGAQAKRNGTKDVVVSAKVTNTGSRDGDEVVQVYVQPLGSAVERAKQELRGYKRVSVKKGASANVQIRFDLASLSYWSVAKHAWVLEPGRYQVLVGNSSRSLATAGVIEVK